MKKHILSLLLISSFSIFSMENKKRKLESTDTEHVSDSESETEEEIKENTDAMAEILTQFLAELQEKTPELYKSIGKNPNGLDFIKNLNNKMLFTNCFLGNVQDVKKLLDGGADINYQEQEKGHYTGYTCLMHAAEHKNIELIGLLLKYKPNLELEDKIYGRTAFMKSLNYVVEPYPKEELEKCIRAAKLLLEAGADINARDGDYYTPLIQHAYLGNLEIVKFLVFNGASIELRNRYGETALDKAKSEGDRTKHIVKFLESYSQVKSVVENILNKTKKIIIKKELLSNTPLLKELADIVLDYCD